MIYLFMLFICHFLADFTHLSRPWMLRAKAIGGPFGPIWCHGMVHGLLMGIVTLIFTGNWIMSGIVILFQALTHSIIDTIKGKLNVWAPNLKSPANVWHWYVFGADQLLHIFCILLIYSFVIHASS